MRGRKSRGERARAPAEEVSVPRQKDGEEREEQEIALRAVGGWEIGCGERPGWQRQRGGATR